MIDGAALLACVPLTCLLQSPVQTEYLLIMLVRREKIQPEMSTVKKTQTTFAWSCGSKIICIYYFYVIGSEKGMGELILAVYSSKM